MKIRNQLDKARLTVVEGFLAAFGPTYYPEDKVIDQRISANGFAYWAGFKTHLEYHFKCYCKKLETTRTGWGWGLFQNQSLFYETKTFLVPIAGGSFNAHDPLGSFSRQLICPCDWNGEARGIEPREYLLKQLSFFIPFFIWEYNKAKSQLHQTGGEINNLIDSLHGLKTALATLLGGSNPEPPKIFEQRYQGRLDQGTAISIRKRDALAAFLCEANKFKIIQLNGRTGTRYLFYDEAQKLEDDGYEQEAEPYDYVQWSDSATTRRKREGEEGRDKKRRRGEWRIAENSFYDQTEDSYVDTETGVDESLDYGSASGTSLSPREEGSVCIPMPEDQASSSGLETSVALQRDAKVVGAEALQEQMVHRNEKLDELQEVRQNDMIYFNKIRKCLHILLDEDLCKLAIAEGSILRDLVNSFAHVHREVDKEGLSDTLGLVQELFDTANKKESKKDIKTYQALVDKLSNDSFLGDDYYDKEETEVEKLVDIFMDRKAPDAENTEGIHYYDHDYIFLLAQMEELEPVYQKQEDEQAGQSMNEQEGWA